MISYEHLVKIIKIQNILTVILSVILLTTTSIYQWHVVPNSRIIQELITIFNLSQNINNITMVIIIYSIVSIIFATVGFVNVKWLNKKLFIINLILLSLLILANFTFVILYLVLVPDYEKQIRNGQLIRIRPPNPLWNIFSASFISNLHGVHNHCTYLIDVYLQFDCCSRLEPGDLTEWVKLECCVKPNPKNSCITMLIKELSFYFNRLIGIPGSMIFINYCLNLVFLIVFLIKFNFEF